MKSISKFLIVVVIILLAAFVLVNSLPYLLHTQHPLVVNQGISMEPTYYDGDLLLLRAVSKNDIKIGDVVAYQRSTSSLLIVHRVVAVRLRNDELYFTTKGDNNLSNPFPDAEIQASYVIGVVSFHVPTWLSKVVSPAVLALQNLFFLALPVGLIAVLLLVVNLSTIEKSGSPKRFCKYCGTENGESAVFCEKCGKRIAR